MKAETQTDLFGTSYASCVAQSLSSETNGSHDPAPRTHDIEGKSRPAWMADDVLARLTDVEGHVSKACVEQAHKLRRLFTDHADVSVQKLTGLLGWPHKACEVITNRAKVDVDTAFEIFYFLMTQTTGYTPKSAFVLGQPRATWRAGLARERLAQHFEGGVLPKDVEKEIDDLASRFLKKSQISRTWLYRNMGWSVRGATSNRSLSQGLRKENVPLDVDEAFDVLIQKHEAQDFVRWDRRGVTIRRQRKDANAAARKETADQSVESPEAEGDSRKCGPRMRELLEAGETFFFEQTGAPAKAPMSPEVKAEFDRICAIPLEPDHQDTDIVEINSHDDGGQAWYEIQWFERSGLAEITLFVATDDGDGEARMVDTWIRAIGSKSRQFLPARLKAQLMSFLYEDGDITP